MAGSLEGILNSVKMLLTKYDISSKAFEEILNTVRNLEQHLQAIRKICDDELESEENLGLVTVKNIVTIVVYGSYIKEKTDAAGLEKGVSNMEVEIEKFPESIRPKVYEIKGYAQGIAAQLKKNDDLLKEIDRMIDEIAKNEYKISRKERIDLERKKLKFEGGLKICGNYQNHAATALKELDSEIASYMKRQENDAERKKKCVAAIATGVGVAAGFVAGSYLGRKAGVTLAGKAVLTAEAGAVGGVSCGLIAKGAYEYFSINWMTSKYNDIKGETSKLNAALQNLKVEGENQTIQLEETKEEIALLVNLEQK